jgi:hypothetical protein
MTQPGLFDDANPTRATMVLYLAWNNGPFDSAEVVIDCFLGGQVVFQHRQSVTHEEMDFSEVFHVAAREANRLVMGHRVTNSHIRRGRVVYSALDNPDLFDSAS